MVVLIVSDIHANLAALDAVIRDAGPFDQIWCLGDIVGYGPDPNECIERLRSFQSLCLAGNHDLAVIGKLNLDDFSSDAREAAIWTRQWLTPANRAWLETLSPSSVIAGTGITLVHASPRDPVWEYVASPAVARHCLEQMETPICLYGHTHIPMIFRQPAYLRGISTEWVRVNVPLTLTLDRILVNPGSVGQPRDDDPRASYALLDLEALTLTWRRVLYDVATTQKKMKEAKLPAGLIRRLRFGQ
jgi:diadenosine tetraphosphatase ApaH/serine/threonine PP2A family protein phosphatase